DKEQALLAYRQHSIHTASRLFLIPNPWIAPDAIWVQTDAADKSKKWANFERYQPLIALFWQAASDETQLNTLGNNVEERKQFFVSSHALINRAHNWDDGRPVFESDANTQKIDSAGNPITEEYDDLAGDKPSCHMGFKRRL